MGKAGLLFLQLSVDLGSSRDCATKSTALQKQVAGQFDLRNSPCSLPAPHPTASSCGGASRLSSPPALSVLPLLMVLRGLKPLFPRSWDDPKAQTGTSEERLEAEGLSWRLEGLSLVCESQPWRDNSELDFQWLCCPLVLDGGTQKLLRFDFVMSAQPVA